MRVENERRMPDRTLRLLGLAKRAGKTVDGAPLIFAAMHRGRAPLLVLAAADASPASRKKIRSQCAFYRVPLLFTEYTKELLGHTVGKDGPVAAVAVTDAGLAEELKKSSGKEASVPVGNEEE